MRILHVTPSFFPAVAFGGPIVSTRRLCDELDQLSDVQVSVLTTNTAGVHTADVLELNADRAAFDSTYAVRYCRKDFGTDFSVEFLRALPAAIRSADVVHLTGVYSNPTIPTLWLCGRLRKPVVWSPRGSLQRWALTRRRAAKWVWERVCASCAISRQVILHVTSQEEARASSARFPELRTYVIPNGVDIPEQLQRSKADDVFAMLYVGRLDPQKGLENLLRALPMVRCSNWRLDICGNGDSAYRDRLMRMSKDLGLESRVCFRGHVEGALKDAHFGAADVCVVPSHSENFGMVVVESLARGVPVIAARGTPWRDLEARQCGYWVDNAPETLAAAIARMAEADRTAMGAAGREWMATSFAWPGVAQQMLRIYQELSAETT